MKIQVREHCGTAKSEVARVKPLIFAFCLLQIVGCRGVPTLLRLEVFGEFAYQFKAFPKLHRQIALLRQRIEHRLPFCWRWIKFLGHVVGRAFSERCTDRCSGFAFVERFSSDQKHHVDKVLNNGVCCTGNEDSAREVGRSH